MYAESSVPLPDAFRTALAKQAGLDQSPIRHVLQCALKGAAIVGAIIAFFGLLADLIHYLQYDVIGMQWRCAWTYFYFAWVPKVQYGLGLGLIGGIALSWTSWKWRVTASECARRELQSGVCEQVRIDFSQEHLLCCATDDGYYFLLVPDGARRTRFLNVDALFYENNWDGLEKEIPSVWTWKAVEVADITGEFRSSGRRVRVSALDVDMETLERDIDISANAIINLPFKDIRARVMASLREASKA